MSNQTTPAKPEVKLPKAVMMQRDKANELLKAEMDRKLKDTPQSTNASDAPPQSQPEPVPTKEPEVAAAPAPQAEPTPKPKEETLEYWMHRFKTSQGMFEAEKTRLRAENQTLKDRLSGFEGQLKELNDKLRVAERQTPKAVDLKKYLSQDQIDTYGPEVLTSVARIASEEASIAADEAAERRFKEELDRQIQPLKAELEQARRSMQAKTADLFLENLERKVPKWQLINDDPMFHEWLDQRDAFSGIRRQDLLAQAEQALDSDRVVAMFDAFIKSSSAPQTTQTPAQPKAEPQRRVVPDPVAAPAVVNPEAGNGAEWMTTKQISEFYRDSALGRYKYRPQEKADMEKKILAARLANRIR